MIVFFLKNQFYNSFQSDKEIVFSLPHLCDKEFCDIEYSDSVVKKNEQVAVGPIFSHGIGGRVEALLFSYVLAHENGEIGQCAQDGGEISSLDAQDDRVHVGGPLYIQAGQDG